MCECEYCGDYAARRIMNAVFLSAVLSAKSNLKPPPGPAPRIVTAVKEFEEKGPEVSQSVLV
jgi:hypothetical protein